MISKNLLRILFLLPLINQCLIGQINLSEFCPENKNTYSDPTGQYYDWIELYNSSSQAQSLKGYYLTDKNDKPDKWPLPDLMIPPSGYLILIASGQNTFINSHWHTNFSLNKDGEYIGLWSDQKNWIDSFSFGSIPTDYSYIKNENGLWTCSFQATPLEKNPTDQNPTDCFIKAPVFNFKSGFYKNSFELQLSTNSIDHKIYFSTNGTDPTLQSTPYTNPIQISKNTSVKAIAVSKSFAKSNQTFGNYFIGETNFSIPVILLSTDPKLLFDDSIGLFKFGPDASQEYPYYGANFWKDTEIPANISYFNINGILQFESNFDIAVHGGKSTRTQAMKPLRVYAKEKYNYPLIPVNIFSELPQANLFKRFVLRNSGSDFNKAHLRDGFLCHYLNTQKLNVESNGYQPVQVFINGEFYGVMEIREKLDAYYPLAQYKLYPDEIDFLEDDTIVVQGSRSHFDSLHQFAIHQDLSLQNNFDQFAKEFNTIGYCDYLISQTYFNNWDWPNNNIKYWRKRNNGQWNYLFYDSDVSLNAFPWAAHTESNLGRIFGPVAENNKHIQIFKSLLNNISFLHYFINRYADLINTSFQSSRIEKSLDSLISVLEPSMNTHFTKWGSSIQEWHNILDQEVRSFIHQRPNFAFEFVRKEFNLDSIHWIEIKTIPENEGIIQLNSLKLNSFPFNGRYFSNIPIQLKANRKAGYDFQFWKIDNDSIFHEEISIYPKSQQKIIAVYKLSHDIQSWFIYPNPTQQDFYIEYQSNLEIHDQLTISDLSGKIKFNLNIHSQVGINQIPIEISALPMGVYFIQLTDRKPQKLVIFR